MATGNTLANVLSMVKAETGKSLAASATAADQQLYQMIENQQIGLADKYDFATQAHWWDVNVTTGNRFVNVPSVNELAATMVINLRRPIVLSRQWNAIWVLLDEGIKNSDYNYLNSDLNVMLDPVQKWRLNGSATFEIWPLPAGPQKIRFNGQGVVSTLRNTGSFDPTKTLDLDDLLVTYFTAARILTKEKQADAEVMLGFATTRLAELRAAEPHSTERVVIGKGGRTRKEIRAVPMVVVHG